MQCMNVFVRLKHPMLTRSSNSTFPYMFGLGAVLLIGYLSKGIVIRGPQYMSSQTNSLLIQINRNGSNSTIRITRICCS